MTTKQAKRRIRVSIVGKYLGWMTIRAVVLIALFIALQTVHSFHGFEYFGLNEATQDLVYMVLLRAIFSLVVWFFLSLSKKIIIPAAILTVSPALGKIVRDPTVAKKTNKSITNYLTYFIYIITIGALVFIWAYQFIGTWFADLLGNGLVIMLTFILGLFSSSVLGNILGYAILGGTHEFKVGDRVQIGDVHGDIIDIGFFFIHIRTIRAEIISIPNLTVMNKEIHNYSSLRDVALNVQVTLGYDVDKDHAQGTLIEAAKKTSGILSVPDKEPFVLLRELGAYAVTYDLNAYTDEPNRLVQIKSELISNMLIELKKAGIVIATPALVFVKGEEKTLPQPITQYMDSRKAN
ncbi:mechanosensitive ion channel family protein [Candidatus Bathycorpusculum sp.]|jgi:small-conductance mechanosensitive channel|uniref:mechanosensitive ion channel family protein n=1 Tax=Candidatus Bathycorpusculum sp. TaxID=2994959 RepID=UPI00282E36D4|nr:mechanosensitive ion channel family protein [Candidatus Termitimicrobium sp.]MCL2686052.1 mechanosensitive ion channel family protein [Candidatus Termitimicrobium sp.]